VASGTDAIHLALRACGVGTGDAVVTTAHTAVPTLCAIAAAGARIILADIDPVTYTLNPAAVERILKTQGEALRIKALVPVHLYGHPADMDPLLELARRYGFRVVEDVAQATGAKYKGREAGTIGDAAAFSFYPTKNLGAYGDGGLVLTRDPDIAARVRKLRNYGERAKFENEEPGFNSRLDELHAAILRAKLPHLEAWNRRRRELAAFYHERLAGAKVVRPREAPFAHHVYHLYVIRHPERDRLRTQLAERGVQTAVHYPRPVHFPPAFQPLGYKPGDLPVAEQVTAEALSLPLYPLLTDMQAERVCQALQELA
jgi:dTDP-4-amino-4,6-dideoxygalactose transaminase